MNIGEANEKLGMQIPKGNYHTIAGFILEFLGHIPSHNEHFSYKDMRFTIIAMQGNRIEKILISKQDLTTKNNEVGCK